MQINIDKTHWYDRIWAALIFFTRLPFWRLHQPPKECYQTVVEHWPLAGWITGGTMAATLYFGSWYLPYAIAVLLAIVVRLLVTGALHEDGLADFLDGFGGGGSNRERILAIMKDSHIGTYGVIGLIFYELLLATVLLSMTPELAALTILAADPYSKMVTSQLITMMPYARSEEEAKNKTVYRKISWQAGVGLAIQGLLPMAAYIWYTGMRWDLIIFIPALVMYFLYLLIWRKIHGYTGDCCGAVCLLVELTKAEELALSLSDNPVYLATAHIWDDEFRERVRKHQERRGPQWTNIEEEINISNHDVTGRVVVIDCITLWLTNIFYQSDSNVDKSLETAKKEFDAFTKYDATYIFVTNEIGLGGVSTNQLQRKFTDLQGWMNQYVAQAADEVILMVSGIPVKIK